MSVLIMRYILHEMCHSGSFVRLVSEMVNLEEKEKFVKMTSYHNYMKHCWAFSSFVCLFWAITSSSF